MAHLEYRSDRRESGVGMGGGDADNSGLVRRPTAVGQRQRIEPAVEPPSERSRSLRAAGQDQVAHATGSCQESQVVATSSSSTDPRKSPGHGKPNQLVRFCLRLGYNALFYPYEFAKVLIQLGHEPLQAKPFLLPLIHGRPRLYLPGVHEYVQHIRRIDGNWGMYRGLPARLAASTVDHLLGDVLLVFLRFGPYRRGPHEDPCLKELLWNLARDSIRMATAVALSQPFYVVMVRQIAQFVGRETTYEGLLGSLTTLANSEGAAGLFAGLVPRLLGELSLLVATSCVSHLCERLLPMSRTQRQYNSVIIQMLASRLVYPLEVTAACMAVTGAPLSACEPPSMPLYNHWADCLSDLHARGGHNRGAVLFWRTVPRIQLLRQKEALPSRAGL
ncbi:mitochondrial carrier homolog 2 [Drosophila ficusphila]|uniref:mitochondrial carrier homolog 2 n=1 Tax=Drosophila ficusphila TaxID=30025 RepID=UPI0007E6E6BE|nr:mitochondrial carrier homolog 2 [Drosophila ficusphila]